MAEMTRAKVGNRKKARRSSHDKPYYTRYRERYSGKLIRRKADRLNRIKAAREHPDIGSPSQLRMRIKNGQLEKRNASNNTGSPVSTG